MNSLNYYLDSYPPLNDTTVAAPTYTDPFADITTGWPRILSYKEANFILKIESNLTFVDLNSNSSVESVGFSFHFARSLFALFKRIDITEPVLQVVECDSLEHLHISVEGGASISKVGIHKRMNRRDARLRNLP